MLLIQKKSFLKNTVIFVMLILAFLSLFPFIWMFLTSFKTQEEINLIRPSILPEVWQFQNYIKAWFTPESTFGKYFINTIIVAGLGTLLELLVCIPVAYSITYFKYPGKDFVFMLVLSTMMIPYDVTLIPNFITIRSFPLVGGNNILGQGGQGFYDSYMGIIIPFLASAFTIFLLRQAFKSVSKTYWHAAQIDGMSHFGYLWRVLVPLCTPSIITATLLSFIGKWNGVIWPLLVTNSESLRPLQVGLLYFISEEGHYYHYLMAAATLAIIPIIVLYFFVQKWFREDLIGSGLKG